MTGGPIPAGLVSGVMEKAASLIGTLYDYRQAGRLASDRHGGRMGE